MLNKIPLIIALLIVGIFPQENNKSIIITDEISSTSQCYEDGYIAGYKSSIDDALIYGVSLYFVVAPAMYFIVSKSHPKPIKNNFENFDDDCKKYFLNGYEKGAIKKRKYAVLYGGATLPVMLLGAYIVGSIQQGKFPPDL